MSRGPLRILHVGAGFRPFRKGGLIAYAEDLMVEQVRRGHKVSYLFSGRFVPVLTAPRVRCWSHGGVTMVEILNSPLHDHGRQPQLELSESRIERIVEKTIREQAPDVVHVQELAGLPSSVLDVARAAGVPTVMTLHDYFLMCPTFRLIDAEGRSCLGHEPGRACAAAMAADPRPPQLLYVATVRHQLERWLPLRRFQAQRSRLIAGIAERSSRSRARPLPAASEDAYLRRREVNVMRLNRVDALVGVSTRVAEIYRSLGVDPQRLQTLQITLRHIERLRPRLVRPGPVVTFASLTGGESLAKGARLLLDAMQMLADSAPSEGYRLLLCGRVSREVAAEARDIPGVELRGPYEPQQLDGLLDQVDVGIMPSIWEEAYGLAGIEFLAKGRPVIANAIGGMLDYVREADTGWLNRSCSAGELAGIMGEIIAHPQTVTALSGRILAAHDDIVMPMARHADAMDDLYDRVIHDTRGQLVSS